MEKIKSIANLLSQVKTIARSYERLNEANGGNFNIFSILKIERDEVTTHSRFIAELLNPNGVHGFGNQFLDLFIETLKIDTELNTDNYKVVENHFIGYKNDDETAGGNIDIFIKGDDGNVIVIENKIDAGEQTNQLLRYHNAYPEGKLLFLTLWGYESAQKESFKEYTPISYSNHIIKWLEECKKVSVNNPTLRETLTQYINLIKKLTNQNISTKMNEELIELFGESEENFYALRDLRNLDMRHFAMKRTVIPALTELKEKFEGFDFQKDLSKLSEKNATLCCIENESLERRNLYICFSFESQYTDGLMGGFDCLDLEKKKDHDYTKLKQEFKDKFKGISVYESSNSPSYFRYDYFMNWSSNPDDLKNLIFGDSQRNLNFKDDLESKIQIMLDIVDNSF